MQLQTAVVNRQQKSLRGRWLLVAISLIVGAVLLTSGAGVWWGSLTNTGDHITDFLGFRTGGQMFWQDRTHLYDLERQLAVETSILAPHPLPRVLPTTTHRSLRCCWCRWRGCPFRSPTPRLPCSTCSVWLSLSAC